jgi:hypothetical protein
LPINFFIKVHLDYNFIPRISIIDPMAILAMKKTGKYLQLVVALHIKSQKILLNSLQKVLLMTIHLCEVSLKTRSQPVSRRSLISLILRRVIKVVLLKLTSMTQRKCLNILSKSKGILKVKVFIIFLERTEKIKQLAKVASDPPKTAGSSNDLHGYNTLFHKPHNPLSNPQGGFECTTGGGFNHGQTMLQYYKGSGGSGLHSGQYVTSNTSHGMRKHHGRNAFPLPNTSGNNSYQSVPQSPPMLFQALQRKHGGR